ncbi:GNAT family N-acetyltransferase [Leisingera sp. ANG-M1]|uniref:GNAT family N-acetyltransferase n=1 Tax=Leisingera sp. ANG-M1 TaxID=1577895 RepID=UPI00068AFBAE|nr:GNAT family N-acetyltransferase [Leisingera sp. ANG-M1]
MLPNSAIRRLDPNSRLLRHLAAEARLEGFRFVDRMIAEADAGSVCFQKAGERFCGVFQDTSLVACGGISRDPYTAEQMGRVRHVYVLKAARRRGVATLLVNELLKQSAKDFQTIRLRTSTAEAARFYETLGFRRTGARDATHIYAAGAA